MFNWLANQPKLLEWLYWVTRAFVCRLEPVIRFIGLHRVDNGLQPIERWLKGKLFNCHMCGQCTVHSTGMICPMTCPKKLRNGACGGVRQNGHCEVNPEMQCVWVSAFERSKQLRLFGAEIASIKPPVNHSLDGSSAWINMLTGNDVRTPEGWGKLRHIPIIEYRA